MRAEDIEENLRRFGRDIAEAQAVLAERPAGFESIADGKFDLLLDELGDERARVGALAPAHPPPDGDEDWDERAAWLDHYAKALDAIWLELDGAAQGQVDKMGSRLDAAAAHLRFHLLAMSKRRLE